MMPFSRSFAPNEWQPIRMEKVGKGAMPLWGNAIISHASVHVKRTKPKSLHLQQFLHQLPYSFLTLASLRHMESLVVGTR